MLSDNSNDNNTCGSKLFRALPDDIFAVVARSLKPRDVLNLAICCRSLYALASSDKVWLTQCEVLGIVLHRDLVEWRKGFVSYQALCRFLVNVEPLIGIWVHQNPELGNVVYVMPGFISVVGCRIIPQELGPLGMDDGPILWSPVFEILGDVDGSSTFLLHGRERENDYLYPGSVKAVDRNCNVLLLEVEPRQQRNGGKLVHSKSFVGNPNPLDKELLSRKICPSDRGISKSQRLLGQKSSSVPFSRLAFGDRRKLIEIVTSQIRVKVSEVADGLSFPCMETQDFNQLTERRSRLMRMYKRDSDLNDWKADPKLSNDPTQSDLSKIRKILDKSTGSIRSQLHRDVYRMQYPKKKSLAGYFRDSFKQIIGKSNGSQEHSKSSSSSSQNSKYAQFQEFLRSGDSAGLTLHASTVRLSSYRAWPNMYDSRFALYKLPTQDPLGGQHTGLWGGTFGWPPGKPSADKPGKALFFLLLSYEESQGQRLLIGTKILEGTHYVLHPNGSAMFIVNVDEPSAEPFPWDCDGDSNDLDLKQAYVGEGIANGYGFRYPGSKPGSLFVFQDGMLVFMWKETRAVLTMQRIDLQDLLKKGERVPPLPPIANFSYLTKSYSNVYAGFSNASNHTSSSPRGSFEEDGIEGRTGGVASVKETVWRRRSMSGIRIGRG